MRDLIERLEKAEGGSRELDALIEDVIDPLVTCDGPGSHADFVDDPVFDETVDCYTTSLDAALALAERVLGEDEALYWLRAVTREAEEDTVSGCIKHLPIDLCIAILKAKQ